MATSFSLPLRSLEVQALIWLVGGLVLPVASFFLSITSRDLLCIPFPLDCDVFGVQFSVLRAGGVGCCGVDFTFPFFPFSSDYVPFASLRPLVVTFSVLCSHAGFLRQHFFSVWFFSFSPQYLGLLSWVVPSSQDPTFLTFPL